MKFVPVPITGGPTDGKRVLFSIWETRVQDYEVFAQETGRVWQGAPTDQTSLHPAVWVSWADGEAFCGWLTERERKAGQLGNDHAYRLPSDHEWSCAVGIGEQEDPLRAPADKKEKIAGVFPWGTVWPPPPGAGNYWGEERGDGNPQPGLGPIPGYRDDFFATASVGSFAPTALGLYDLGGNVWELCEPVHRVTRGGSAFDGMGPAVLSSFRGGNVAGFTASNLGFRVVLAPVP